MGTGTVTLIWSGESNPFPARNDAALADGNRWTALTSPELVAGRSHPSPPADYVRLARRGLSSGHTRTAFQKRPNRLDRGTLPRPGVVPTPCAAGLRAPAGSCLRVAMRRAGPLPAADTVRTAKPVRPAVTVRPTRAEIPEPSRTGHSPWALAGSEPVALMGLVIMAAGWVRHE